MTEKEFEERRNHIREISIHVLDHISEILVYYDTDLYYAKKWEKIKTKSGLRRWLFYKLNYGFYDGEPPTVEECHEMYNNLLIRYVLILDSKYWKVDVISNLIDFLSRKKAYTVNEAVELYEKKFA